MKRTRHKRIVFRCITEYNELCCADTISILCQLCRFLDLFLTVDTVLPCPGKILDFLADLAVVIIIS